MIVKNLNGTSDSPKCPCKTWIKHWANYTGVSPGLCAVSDCSKEAAEGAHVQLKGVDDNSWYIVPLCKEHNGKHGKELIISDHIDPVPVSSRHKCGS